MTDQYYSYVFHNGCDSYNINIFNYPFKYTPYPNTSACSVFCKHPVDPNTKKALEKIKRMLTRQRNFCITGSTVTQNNNRNQMNVFSETMQTKRDHVSDMYDDDIDHNLLSNDQDLEYDKECVYVPECLFRRYTETDSRPPTPLQRLTSTTTATSTRAVAANAFLTSRSKMAQKRNRRRRCITPDPVVDSMAVEKKLLVLDLRKSYSQDSLNLEGKRISNKASSEIGCIASSDYSYSLTRTMSNNVYDVGSSLPINTKFGSQMSWLLPNTTNIVKTSSTEALKEERAKLKWITKPYKEQKKLNFADTREKKIVINYGKLNGVKNQILRSEDANIDKDLSAEKGYSFPLSTTFNSEKRNTTIKETKKKKVITRKQKKKKSKPLMLNNVIFNNSHDHIHSEIERSIEICETLISTDYIDEKNTVRSTEYLRKTTSADNSSCSSTSRKSSKSSSMKKDSNYESSSSSSSNDFINDNEFKYGKENKDFLIRKHSSSERAKSQLHKKQNSEKLLLDQNHYKRKQFSWKQKDDGFIVATEMDDKMKILLNQEELHPQSYHTSTTVEQFSVPEVIVESSEQQQFTTIFALSKTFSRRNARFELPVDKSRLIGMKPLEYLNRYVNVTNTYRLVCYRIFKLHARTIANAEYIEKTDELFDALACVVGRNFSQDQRKSFLDILDLSVTSGDSQLSVRIYFQTWCGISALCERIYGEFFAFKYLSRLEDPCTEMEEADFEFLEKKIANLHLDHNLRMILFKLRNC